MLRFYIKTNTVLRVGVTRGTGLFSSHVAGVNVVPQTDQKLLWVVRPCLWLALKATMGLGFVSCARPHVSNNRAKTQQYFKTCILLMLCVRDCA